MLSRGATSVGPTALLAARVVAAALSVGFAALLIYTIATDGSPFRMEVLTPWMATTLVDYYLSVSPVYIVILVRERSVLAGVLWALLCASLGACAVWAYVLVALLRVRPGVPLAELVAGASLRGGRAAAAAELT